jgi:hypothetical protein
MSQLKRTPKVGGQLENSREAAQDYSPRRKPWVLDGNRFSPEGAKEKNRCDTDPSALTQSSLPITNDHHRPNAPATKRFSSAELK